MSKHIEQMADRMLWFWKQQGQWASAYISCDKVLVSLYVRHPLDVLQGKVLGEFGHKPGAFHTSVFFAGNNDDLHRNLVAAMHLFSDQLALDFEGVIDEYRASGETVDRVDMLFDDENVQSEIIKENSAFREIQRRILERAA